jgi:hypothetical protein
MDPNIIKTASVGIFLVIIGLLVIISLLSAYVFIRYGRNTSFTILTSLVFGGVFVLGTITALITLLTIF